MEHSFIGIDVAKDHLDVHVRPTGEVFRVTSDDAGLGTLLTRLRALSPTVIALEATGGYEVPVAAALASAALPVAVVNPRQIRDFARATGQLAKTDRLDARVIARFAEAVRPTPRPVPDAQAQALGRTHGPPAPARGHARRRAEPASPAPGSPAAAPTRCPYRVARRGSAPPRPRPHDAGALDSHLARSRRLAPLGARDRSRHRLHPHCRSARTGPPRSSPHRRARRAGALRPRQRRLPRAAHDRRRPGAQCAVCCTWPRSPPSNTIP